MLDACQTFVELLMRPNHLETIIRTLITYGQLYRKIMPFLNYVRDCIQSFQTASCAEISVRHPFNWSWQTSKTGNSRTSLLPLPALESITSANSMSPFGGLPRRDADFSSLVCQLLRSMLKSFRSWTLAPLYWEWSDLSPAGLSLLWFDQIMVRSLSQRRKIFVYMLENVTRSTSPLNSLKKS